MARHKAIQFRTAFGSYTSQSVLGEGGAGIVYAARDDKDQPVAIKILDPAKASQERLKRFKNEYLFGFSNQHQHLLRVLDFGVVERDGIPAPFYVMPQYVGSLRRLLKVGIRTEDALPVFSRILSGVEAAHLLKVTHRDLKPENIMANDTLDLVIGDFGIARFEEEELHTVVETKQGERLANFAYAAPEQRKRGGSVDHRADIFALGLILNELFTGEVPQGTGYRAVGSVIPAYTWLDDVVSQLIQFDAAARPNSIAGVRELLRMKSDLFESKQRLSELSKAVVPTTELDDPLALEAPEIVGVDFDGKMVVIKLTKSVNPGWVDALRNMGSYSSARGAEPERFIFQGNEARVGSDGDNAQQIVDHFKQWLPQATARYRMNIAIAKRREEERQREGLRRQRKELERQERIRSALKY
jgi:serine/threonine protein kinase